MTTSGRYPHVFSTTLEKPTHSQEVFIARCRNGCGYETLGIFNEEGAVVTAAYHEEKSCSKKGQNRRLAANRKKKLSIAGTKAKASRLKKKPTAKRKKRTK